MAVWLPLNLVYNNKNLKKIIDEHVVQNCLILNNTNVDNVPLLPQVSLK